MKINTGFNYYSTKHGFKAFFRKYKINNSGFDHVTNTNIFPAKK
jgi:hypothetical protein